MWIPIGTAEHFRGLDESLEIVETPTQPETDARLGEVEVLVPPLPTGEMGLRLKALLAEMRALRFIQLQSAGVNRYLDALPDGVTICSARGAQDGIVSEWVLSAILAGLKQFPLYRDEQAAHRWTPRPGESLDGSTVLIYGYGGIGRAVEARLTAFGPQVVRVARHAREGVVTPDALPRLLPLADVIVVLLPLTEETRGVIDASFLAQLRNGALLVNAARGPLVDFDALAETLGRGQLRAVFDVADPEPLPESHRLWREPAFFLTPHIAGHGSQGHLRIYEIVRAQLGRWAAGEPLSNIAADGY